MIHKESERVPNDIAIERLRQFHHLSAIIDEKWLQTQLKKCVEKYSLITGWLTTPEEEWKAFFHPLVNALDQALDVLKGKVSPNTWKKITHKIRAASDRAETKGTLAEISMAVFLTKHGIQFEMEKQLDPCSKKDVDFSITYEGEEIHIEMQWLSESKRSRVPSDIALEFSPFETQIDFPYEKRRIRNKIKDKCPKFTQEDITLVALDCTEVPELGGKYPSAVYDALRDIFHKKESLDDTSTQIRSLVDGVIWFKLDINNALCPQKRGYISNPHRDNQSLSNWLDLWGQES